MKILKRIICMTSLMICSNTNIFAEEANFESEYFNQFHEFIQKDQTDSALEILKKHPEIVNFKDKKSNPLIFGGRIKTR